jgi:hypothetical protein
VSLELRVVAECGTCGARRVLFTDSIMPAIKAIRAWGWRWLSPGDEETLTCVECIARMHRKIA